MKRWIKRSIAALVLVPAFGIAMAVPAPATQVNLSPNHCGARSTGQLDTCVFVAVPDVEAHLFVRVLNGTATATVSCNATVIVTISVSGTTAIAYAHAGGVCTVTVVLTAGTGLAEAWTTT